MGLVPYKNHQRACFLSLLFPPCDNTKRCSQSITQRGLSPEPDHAGWHLDLGLPSPQNCEKCVYCLSHPVYGTWLQQPKLTLHHPSRPHHCFTDIDLPFTLKANDQLFKSLTMLPMAFQQTGAKVITQYTALFLLRDQCIESKLLEQIHTQYFLFT